MWGVIGFRGGMPLGLQINAPGLAYYLYEILWFVSVVYSIFFGYYHPLGGRLISII